MGLCSRCAISAEITWDERDYSNQLNQVQFDAAMELAAAGKLREANDLLLNLYGRTKSPRVLLEGARVLYLAEELDESEKLFRQVLELNPPMMVRERIVGYLDDIENSRGRLKVSFGIVRDTNPKAVTNSRTLTIFGQNFDYRPQVDTSSQWGTSYLLTGYKNYGAQKEWGAGFSVNGAKFATKDFDRTGLEEFLTYRMSDFPKVVAKTSVEQYFIADKILYAMPAVSIKHTSDMASGRYWTNEIKNGWIDYSDYTYLNGVARGYTTSFGMPVADNLILGLEAGVDRTTAVENAYAFKSATGALVANVYIPSEYVKAQIKYSHTNRKYEGIDPFFGEIRNDKKNGVYLNLVKTDWVFWGLMPSIDLGYENSESNIELYSYRRVISTLSFKKAY